MKLKSRLKVTGITVFVLAALSIVLLTNHFQKRQALEHARQKAMIILQHNLAIHTYFAKQLKPGVFAQFAGHETKDSFEPAWMSSTFAVREIDKYFREAHDRTHYYKEAAINARSPENEADQFERDFIRRLNSGTGPDRYAGIQTIGGKPFFVTMLRGESMEQDCLRCHSTPEQAPQGLVDRYGAQRSFSRSAREVVSAISIRVPLEEEFAQANLFSAKIAGGLVLTITLLLLVQNRVYQRLIVPPLNAVRSEARRIAETPELIGSQLPLAYAEEMNDVATSFNILSTRMKSFIDNLETTIEQRTREARTNEERYRLLFEQMTSGFALHEMLYDDQGQPQDYRFLEVNPAFEQLTGLKGADIVGHTVLEALPETERFWIDTYGRVADGGEAIAFENYSAALGKHFMVWAFCSAPGQFATIFSDITELRQYQTLIEEKNAELERFTYLVSHDLKSPLVTIRTFLGYLEQDMATGNGERVQQDISYLTTAANKMDQLLAELLAFSRLGNVRVSPEATSFQSTVAEALSLVAGQIAGRGIRVVVTPDDYPLFGDRPRLVTVWQNLLDNAVKFSGEQAEPIVELGFDRRGNETVFFVRDNGIGISHQHHESIFTLFTRLDHGQTGSGLGLALVKRIVELHGGRIWVESSGAGQGTYFRFTLPGPAAPPAAGQG